MPTLLELTKERAGDRMKDKAKENKAHKKAEKESVGKIYQEAPKPVRKTEAGKYDGIESEVLSGTGSKVRDIKIHKKLKEAGAN